MWQRRVALALAMQHLLSPISLKTVGGLSPSKLAHTKALSDLTRASPPTVARQLPPTSVDQYHFVAVSCRLRG